MNICALIWHLTIRVKANWRGHCKTHQNKGLPMRRVVLGTSADWRPSHCKCTQCTHAAWSPRKRLQRKAQKLTIEAMCLAFTIEAT